MRPHTLKRAYIKNPASFGHKRTYRKRGGFHVANLVREEEVLQKTLILKHKDKKIKELLMIPRGVKISVSRENVDSQFDSDINESPKTFRFVFFVEGNSTPYYVSDYQILGETAIHALFSTLPLEGTTTTTSASISDSEPFGSESSEPEDDMSLKYETARSSEYQQPQSPGTVAPTPAESPVAPAESPVAPAESPVPNPEAPAESPVPNPEAPAESPVPNPEAPAESPVPNPEAPAESPVPNPEAPAAEPLSEQKKLITEPPSLIESLFTTAKTEKPQKPTGFFASLFSTQKPTDEKTVQSKSRE